MTGNAEFSQFVGRVIKAHGRRVAAGDVEGLAHMRQLSELLDEWLVTAAQGLHAEGYSWAEIARPLGITKQAAHLRFAKKEQTS